METLQLRTHLERRLHRALRAVVKDHLFRRSRAGRERHFGLADSGLLLPDNALCSRLDHLRRQFLGKGDGTIGIGLDGGQIRRSHRRRLALAGIVVPHPLAVLDLPARRSRARDQDLLSLNAHRSLDGQRDNRFGEVVLIIDLVDVERFELRLICAEIEVLAVVGHQIEGFAEAPVDVILIELGDPRAEGLVHLG